MDVLILGSANKNIDPYYTSVARSISSFLASDECNLILGGTSSMLGVCYEEFKKQEREIYLYTTQKYMDELKNVKSSRSYIKEDTFEMKKSMFIDSDMIICLPGGIGTLSELFSYIEEKRSNNSDVPIIIYDENHFYDKTFEALETLEEQKFIGNNLKETYNIARTKQEFEDLYISKKGKVR